MYKISLLQGSGGGIKSITISASKMTAETGQLIKQPVWVLTTTEKESMWYQGQFRIPELELDEYYVSFSYYLFIISSKPFQNVLNSFCSINDISNPTLSQLTIEADIGEKMERWMALDDFMFSVVSDEECMVMPPEADPSPPTTTTVKPYEGMFILEISFREVYMSKIEDHHSFTYDINSTLRP